MDIATACFSNTKREPRTTCSKPVTSQLRQSWKRTHERPEAKSYPSTLSECLRSARNHGVDPISDTPEGCVADVKGSFDSMCFLARKSHKLFASVGRDGIAPTPVHTVLDFDEGPVFIRKRRLDPASHSYICSVKNPGLLRTSRRMTTLYNIGHLTVRIREI